MLPCPDLPVSDYETSTVINFFSNWVFYPPLFFLRFLRSQRQSRPEDLCRRILVISPSGSFAWV